MELELIQNKIYEIRGHSVMLDFDLAALYQVETRSLKQSVKRNLMRFPEDFMFQLSKSEWQEVITICDNLPETIKYSPAPPFAFTQEGVAMLSGVLRSPLAVQVNIGIMRAFVALRKLLATSTEIGRLFLENAEIRAKLELLERNDESTLESVNDLSEQTRADIDNLYAAIGELSIRTARPAPPPKPRRPIGY